MRWFGPNWGAPMCEPETHTDTPAGEKCYVCDEPIAMGDSGVVLPYLGETGASTVSAHAECNLMTVTGNIHHLRGECQHRGECYELTDKSLREQAIEVWNFYGKPDRP